MADPSCPGCDQTVAFPHGPRLDETVMCASCDAMLVVVSLSPVELDWACDDDGSEDGDA